jgi:thioredoxin-related protein
MKKLFVFVVLISVAQCVMAQDSVRYYKSWEKALKAAKKTNKLIFLDAYTSWCAPCKRMEATTFKNAEVIKALNEKFIPIKLNMERGEGIALAKNYRIGGYPTLLFIDAEGKMLHSEAGFKNDSSFLAMSQTALNPTERLEGLDEKFNRGDWDSEFLKSYIDKRAILMNASQDAAIEAYLKLLPDWTQPEVMDFIMGYVVNPGSLGFMYLLDKKQLFSTKYGANQVNQRIEGIVYQELTKGSHRTELATMNKIIAQLYPEGVERIQAKYKITYHLATLEPVLLMEATEAYVTNFPPEDPAELADFAVGIAAICSDKAQLKKAMTWVEDAFKKEENFECQLAMAYLYKAMGKKKKAKKMANKAIAWAKEKQENYAPAVQFLSTLE